MLLLADTDHDTWSARGPCVSWQWACGKGQIHYTVHMQALRPVHAATMCSLLLRCPQ
jgi:hypothetical protein